MDDETWSLDQTYKGQKGLLPQCHLPEEGPGPSIQKYNNEEIVSVIIIKGYFNPEKYTM